MKPFLVVLNMSATEQKVGLDLSPLGFAAPKLSVLLNQFPQAAARNGGGTADGALLCIHREDNEIDWRWLRE